MPRRDLVAFRRGTAAEWSAANPVLALGEPGWDTTNSLLKIGDGVTAWNGLGGFGGAAARQLAASATNYGPSIDGAMSSVVLTNGEMKLAPFVVGNTIDVNTFVVYTITGLAASTYNVGLYRTADGRPSSLVVGVSGIPTATSAAQVAQGFTTKTLTPGVYWLGGYTENGGGTVVLPAIDVSSPFVAASTNPPANNNGYVQNTAGGGLPPSISPTGTTTKCPLVFLRTV